MLLKIKKHMIFSSIVLFLFSCNATSTITEEEKFTKTTINILSLGDSYTIGQNVCESCKFPQQLKDSLQSRNRDLNFNLQIIARTGWNTRNLIDAIETSNLASNYNVVTLLIGVNNQFQRIPFSTFENEFSVLVKKAIKPVNSDKDKLIILSIPDYAYTPFGRESENISNDIETYNIYIKNFCRKNDITFLNITDITKMGLTNPSLVANDGLHPSKEAYTKFVERLLPLVSSKLSL